MSNETEGFHYSLFLEEFKTLGLRFLKNFNSERLGPWMAQANASASTSKFFPKKKQLSRHWDSRKRVKSKTCAPTNVLLMEKTFWLAH
jgi:hypothetical protein